MICVQAMETNNSGKRLQPPEWNSPRMHNMIRHEVWFNVLHWILLARIPFQRSWSYSVFKLISCFQTTPFKNSNAAQIWSNILACLEWRGCGNGVGTGWERGRAHPFEISPPPVVSKGCVESGEFNKRATSRQPGGGGGLVSKGCVE